MNQFNCEIKEHIGIISESKNGWTKELNLVSWNDNDPKYDIRDWDPKHEKMSRGITLTEEEAYELSILLTGEFNNQCIKTGCGIRMFNENRYFWYR